MWLILKIGGIFFLIIMIALIGAFSVYLSTSELVPGDRTYQVKRYSEKVIDDVSSYYPLGYAYFGLLKSQRRYQEVMSMAQNDKDITPAAEELVTQIRATLLLIQTIPSQSDRINMNAQYQTFLADVRDNSAYMIEILNTNLKNRGKAPVKTFTLDTLETEGGRLVSKPKTFVQKSITQKDPAPDSVLIQNIAELDTVSKTAAALLQK